MFRIYETTGTYPNLVKGTLLFEHPNVTISGGINKSIEDDIIPLETFPDAWDSYTVMQNVKVDGVISETDTETVYQQYQKIMKIMYDYAPSTTWSDQPDFNDSEERDVLAFCFYIPKKSGGDDEITYYGMVNSFVWNYASGSPHLNYTIDFKCYARRWVL
jgi:hypothetical protein